MEINQQRPRMIRGDRVQIKRKSLRLTQIEQSQEVGIPHVRGLSFRLRAGGG